MAELTDVAVREEVRFWKYVNKTETCWLWTGTKLRGYGMFWRNGTPNIRAHRFAWTVLRGPIPEGLCLDHLCRVRSCVRPDHLRLATTKENVLALGSESRTAINAKKTHCPVGHVYADQRIYFDARRRRRSCRICKREADRKRNASSRKLSKRITELESALRQAEVKAHAEGRREGLEEAAKVAEQHEEHIDFAASSSGAGRPRGTASAAAHGAAICLQCSAGDPRPRR